MRNLEEFNGVFKNKVAFIIASGPSINDQDLTVLKQGITFAVNSGYVAYPLADFFVTDDKGAADWSYFFDTLKNNRWTTPLLYEGVVPNIFGDRTVLFKHRLGREITDRYSHSEYKDHLVQATTSVGTAIHIAHIMGCSPIVLLGVDGQTRNGVKYFWQEKTGRYQIPIKRKHKSYAAISPRRKTKLKEPSLTDIVSYWAEAAPFMRKMDIYRTAGGLVTQFPIKNIKEVLHEYSDRLK